MEQGGLFDAIGNMFVASLKMLVVPLVLVSLICGASSLGDSARMGPIAVKTLGLYLATTALAITIALLFALLIGPGSGIDLVTTVSYTATPPPPLADVLVDIIPSNPCRRWPRARCCKSSCSPCWSATPSPMRGGRPAYRELFPGYGNRRDENGGNPHAGCPYGVFALLVKLCFPPRVLAPSPIWRATSSPCWRCCCFTAWWSMGLCSD